MKGIILAGGSGTRLYPLTLAVSKQLLPVYDKPMIYYPLSTLMLAGIREMLVITTPARRCRASSACSATASQLGHAHRATPSSRSPSGLAQAFLIGARVRRRRAASRWSLGDNIFYGHGLARHLRSAAAATPRARRSSPTACGPAALRRGRVRRRAAARSASRRSPQQPQLAATPCTGLYFYDNQRRRHRRRRSSRRRAASWRSPTSTAPTSSAGELHVEMLGRGIAWLDTGTHESLLQALELHPGHRGAPGAQGRLPRGDRLPHGLHRPRTTSLRHRRRPCARATTASTCCSMLEQACGDV